LNQRRRIGSAPLLETFRANEVKTAKKTVRWSAPERFRVQEESNGPDRSRANDALITAETRLRLVMRAANIGFWDWDVKTNAVYHSAEWKRQLGYEDHEITNDIEEWRSRLHPDDAARVQGVVDAFLKEPTPGYDIEFRLRHRDGSYRWIHSQGLLIRDQRGAPARLLGVHVDVTAAKSRELELRKSAEEHARLAAIVESSNDAIIGETLEGIITSWNKSAERIYGYSAQEALGRPVHMLVPPERVEELAQILAQLKQGGVISHLETTRLRKGGHPIHVSLVVSPIRDLQGSIIGASAIARDITERKQLEKEVLQISEREQQRIAQDLHDGLGQLLSGTVHLTSVLQLELAEQALPEAAEALRITELLNQATAEARSLARGLYPVRAESNGLMVALEELAARTRELFHVSCALRCRKPVLIHDNALATHLYRIAQEAITNSLKHGKARHLQIVLTGTAQRYALVVRDDGHGFVPEAREGRGLGIRIMQYRASMMGGCLTIQKESRRGVRVACTVPRHAS
jgi:PAS domain S-box-containing protein